MGNPFTSAMNAATFIAANAGSFDPYYQALYVYDGLSGVYKYAAAETRVSGRWIIRELCTGRTGIFCTRSLRWHCVQF